MVGSLLRRNPADRRDDLALTVTTTDAIRQTVSEQIEALRPMLDGIRKPSGFRVAVWLNPDGRVREIEAEPVFKSRPER
jgi:hypothetical protein